MRKEAASFQDLATPNPRATISCVGNSFDRARFSCCSIGVASVLEGSVMRRKVDWYRLCRSPSKLDQGAQLQLLLSLPHSTLRFQHLTIQPPPSGIDNECVVRYLIIAVSNSITDLSISSSTVAGTQNNGLAFQKMIIVFLYFLEERQIPSSRVRVHVTICWFCNSSCNGKALVSLALLFRIFSSMPVVEIV
jgi:hypothetical protein